MIQYVFFMRNNSFFWILMGVMLLIDLYIYQAFKTIIEPLSNRPRLALSIGYWAISVISILFIGFLPYLQLHQPSKHFLNFAFSILTGIFFAKILAVVFFLIDDIRRGIQWVYTRISSSSTATVAITEGEAITRSAFLSWLGFIAGGTLFSQLLYGFKNKYNYQVKKVKLQFDNLPSSFKGLKVVQLSDIHSGSFTNKEKVMHGVDMVNSLKPDLILFTGDLVNNLAEEIVPYKEIFNKLQAPMGVYSTLGNHDYGDYVTWESAEAKKNNLDTLKQHHAEMGWKLLMNENVTFSRGTDTIALLGIENWSSKARFPKHGKMDEAYKGVEMVPFKMLMSHDPSHWEAQVIPQYADVDLMLAGHTHGMQFGIEIPGFKWSPVQYMYKQWAGLYEKGNQKLYVNRGFGFIGYPGRVGILPEITLFELV